MNLTACNKSTPSPYRECYVTENINQMLYKQHPPTIELCLRCLFTLKFWTNIGGLDPVYDEMGLELLKGAE